MLIWTAHVSKRKAVFLILISGAIIAALIFLAARSATETQPDSPQLLTNEDRVAYLTSYGWELEAEPVETLQFLLPGLLFLGCVFQIS